MPYSASCFDGWRGRWLYIQDDSSCIDETAVPAAPAVKRPSWDAEAPDTVYLRSLRGRVAELQRRGLTGAKVMLDALKHRLAPLRKDMEIFPAAAEADLLDQTHIMWCMVKLFGTKMAKMATGEAGGDEDGDDGDQVDGSEAVDDEEEVDGNARSPPRRRQRTTTGCLRLRPPAHPFQRGVEEKGGEEDDGVDEEDDGGEEEVDDDDDIAGSAGTQGVDDEDDDVAGSAAAPHLLLPQSFESIQVVGSKRPLSTVMVARKLDKFSKIQEANPNCMKVLELQQKMSSDKVETAKLAYLTAQENRESKKLEMERKKLKMESKKLKMQGKKLENESKMIDAYNKLISQDTSSMTDDEKSERVAAIRCLRKTLFPEIN